MAAEPGPFCAQALAAPHPQATPPSSTGDGSLELGLRRRRTPSEDGDDERGVGGAMMRDLHVDEGGDEPCGNFRRIAQP